MARTSFSRSSIDERRRSLLLHRSQQQVHALDPGLQPAYAQAEDALRPGAPHGLSRERLGAAVAHDDDRVARPQRTRIVGEVEGVHGEGIGADGAQQVLTNLSRMLAGAHAHDEDALAIRQTICRLARRIPAIGQQPAQVGRLASDRLVHD